VSEQLTDLSCSSFGVKLQYCSFLLDPALIILMSVITAADWFAERRYHMSDVGNFDWEDVYGYGITLFIDFKRTSL